MIVVDVAPGEVQWLLDWGPKKVIGDCSHDCEHTSTIAIAWGPDIDHYTLDECGECRCRAWIPVKRREWTTKPMHLYHLARWKEIA